jgi:NitT/TauT family transport system permease protein
MPPSLLLERTQAGPNPRQEQAARAKGVPQGRSRAVTLLRGVSGVVVLAALWEFLPRWGVVDAYFIPPLHVVLQAWWKLAESGVLWQDIKASLVRSGAGFAIAVAIGIPLGATIAWSRPVREFFQPVLEVFRNTAALALLPAFTLVLGIGETSKIAIVTYACFFPILLNTISGVAGVDPQLLRTARVLGLSPVGTFRKVVLPAALPTIFTGVRIAGSVAILVLIAAEMVGANSGIGFLINYAEFNFLIPKMYAAIITASALGLAVNYGLVAIERRFSRWRT